MALFDEYMECLRKIYNRDHQLRKELGKIEGLQFRLQFDGSDFPWTKRIVSEVVEITLRKPPPGVFEAPADYRRLERVENLDF
jgi:hypothetical protein